MFSEILLSNTFKKSFGMIQGNLDNLENDIGTEQEWIAAIRQT